MLKYFITFLFSFFILSHTVSYANEGEDITKDAIETQEISDAPEQEEVSQAEKEAAEAEMAELEEVGAGEEPVAE